MDPVLQSLFSGLPNLVLQFLAAAAVYCVGIAAVPSVGPVCVGLNGMKFGPDRVVRALTRSLFLEEAEAHVAAVEAFADTAAPSGDDPLVI